MCALIAGVVAVDQRRNADTAATTARARRLLSEAQVLAPENLQVALLLASEAVDLDPTINTAGLIGLIPPAVGTHTDLRRPVPGIWRVARA